MLREMMKNDLANLDKAIDCLHPKTHICSRSWLMIKQGDLVSIEIGLQVYIEYKKAIHCTNRFILDQHFEKLEE